MPEGDLSDLREMVAHSEFTAALARIDDMLSKQPEPLTRYETRWSEPFFCTAHQMTCRTGRIHEVLRDPA